MTLLTWSSTNAGNGAMNESQLRVMGRPEPRQVRQLNAGSANNTAQFKAMLYKEFQRTINIECAEDRTGPLC